MSPLPITFCLVLLIAWQYLPLFFSITCYFFKKNIWIIHPNIKTMNFINLIQISFIYIFIYLHYIGSYCKIKWHFFDTYRTPSIKWCYVYNFLSILFVLWLYLFIFLYLNLTYLYHYFMTSHHTFQWFKYLAS